MKTRIKPLIALLFMAGSCSGGAYAASLERIDYLGAGGYSAVTDDGFVSDTVLDLSPAAGDVALFGANLYSTSLIDGSLEHSYAADVFLSFSGAGTDLSMSLSHALSATASNTLNIASHTQDVFVDLTTVTLKIVGEAGEINGLPVQVSFAGNASALHDFDSIVSGGYLGLGLSVSRGSDVVGEYLWDVQQGGDQSVSFSFTGSVGEEIILSSFMLAGASLEDVSFAASASPYMLVDAGALLSGAFTVAIVAEPETHAMLLAGLGLLGFMSRRRFAEH